MFICEDCLKKHYGVIGALAPLSHGPCEMCGKVTTCLDIHHRQLPAKIPIPKPKKIWSVS